MNWWSWDSLCRSKMRGGMRFKHLESFNMALLAKQGWRLLTSPQLLLARLLKGKYFPFTSFMNSTEGSKPS